MVLTTELGQAAVQFADAHRDGPPWQPAQVFVDEEASIVTLRGLVDEVGSRAMRIEVVSFHVDGGGQVVMRYLGARPALQVQRLVSLVRRKEACSRAEIAQSLARFGLNCSEVARVWSISRQQANWLMRPGSFGDGSTAPPAELDDMSEEVVEGGES